MSMVHGLEITDKLLTAYNEDSAMSAFCMAVRKGWSWASKRQAPVVLHFYWIIRDELYEFDGFLYLGEKLLIPTSARKEMLERLHAGHLGIQNRLGRPFTGLASAMIYR